MGTAKKEGTASAQAQKAVDVAKNFAALANTSTPTAISFAADDIRVSWLMLLALARLTLSLVPQLTPMRAVAI